MGKVNVRAFELGPFATNCYLVWEGKSGFVVDASYGAEVVGRAALLLEVEISHIVLTHAHCDHIAGLDGLRKSLPRAKVLVHESEKAWLANPELNLSAFLGEPVSVAAADETLKGGEELQLAGRKWKVLHVPGHSPGSVGLFCAAEEMVISGDALFRDSIGRTDFPNCSFELLAKSIREQLYTLPEDTRVLPGHGAETTVGREMRGNAFVRP